MKGVDVHIHWTAAPEAHGGGVGAVHEAVQRGREELGAVPVMGNPESLVLV